MDEPIKATPARINIKPKTIAFSDAIIPAGIGRKFVRFIILSVSDSAKWFKAPDPADIRHDPNNVTKNVGNQ